MKRGKNKGFLIIEAVAAIWIFTIFLSMIVPVIKNSIKIKNSVLDEIRYERNFVHVIEKMNEELRNADSIEKSDRDGGIKGIYQSYQNDVLTEKYIVYYFSESLELKRYVNAETQNKADILIKDIEGKFFEEEGMIKMKVKYKNREEEYVYRQK